MSGIRDWLRSVSPPRSQPSREGSSDSRKRLHSAQSSSAGYSTAHSFPESVRKRSRSPDRKDRMTVPPGATSMFIDEHGYVWWGAGQPQTSSTQHVQKQGPLPPPPGQYYPQTANQASAGPDMSQYTHKGEGGFSAPSTYNTAMSSAGHAQAHPQAPSSRPGAPLLFLHSDF